MRLGYINFNGRFYLFCFLFYLNAFSTSNKTFFLPRQIIDDPTLQYAQFDFINHNKKTHDNFSININAFYKESTNSSDLAKYFLPKDKNFLEIKGLGAKSGDSPDISAEWLNISSDSEDGVYPDNNDLYKFSSKIKIHPKYKRFGLSLKLYKELYKHFYASIFVPFMQAESNLGLDEFDKNNERSDTSIQNLNKINNASQAFGNPLMKYGKMDNSWHSLSGIADIRLELGFMQNLAKIIRADIYGSFIAPTGHDPKAEYVLEPIVGGNHFGLGAGLNLDVKVINFFNLTNRFDLIYFFPATELRSFDLSSNGPWSRYMLATNDKVSDRPIPIINFLTKNMRIEKDLSFNWLLSLHFSRKNFDFECGYNLFFRSKEHTRIMDYWNEQISIAYFPKDRLDKFGDSFTSTAKNYKEKSINSDITDDGGKEIDFSEGLISSDNLKIESASCPSLLTNKFYLSAQVKQNINNNILSLNVGASYEISSKNNGLSEWGVFLGAGVKI